MSTLDTIGITIVGIAGLGIYGGAMLMWTITMNKPPSGVYAHHFHPTKVRAAIQVAVECTPWEAENIEQLPIVPRRLGLINASLFWPIPNRADVISALASTLEIPKTIVEEIERRHDGTRIASQNHPNLSLTALPGTDRYEGFTVFYVRNVA